MGILTDDDGLVDAAPSEILALSPDSRQERDPDGNVAYLLIQHHLGQVSQCRPFSFPLIRGTKLLRAYRAMSDGRCLSRKQPWWLNLGTRKRDGN